MLKRIPSKNKPGRSPESIARGKTRNDLFRLMRLRRDLDRLLEEYLPGPGIEEKLRDSLLALELTLRRRWAGGK